MAARLRVSHDQATRVFIPLTYLQPPPDPEGAPNTPGPPYDLTGWTAFAQIRDGYADNGGVLLASFSSADGTILIGGSAIDPTNGQVWIDSANDVDLVDFESGDYVWDILLVDDQAQPLRLVEGPWIQRPRVTVVAP